MRLPKRLNTILKQREEFLDQIRTKFENTALRLQTSLFEDIISDIIPRLDIENGKILETANNYRLISELDKLYSTFNIRVIDTILPQINKGIQFIANISDSYFTLSAGTVARFDKIVEGAKLMTDLKIGLRAEKMIRGGYLMSVLNTDNALTELKSLLSKAVTGQSSMKEFINAIKDNVNGTDVKAGVFDRQLRRFAYDTYQQYDAAYNKKLGEEFGMKYFVYRGGIVKDSRDFCVCHNDKVFSIEEAEIWREWKPADCDHYPEGWPKATDLYSHPSYMDLPGYDPLSDRGGYNCRHMIGFISDDLAFKYRPELK